MGFTLLYLGSGREITDHRLGPDILGGDQSQARVEPGQWQAARTTGAWTLVGCTVSPGFEFAGFELAPPNWRPS